MELTVPNPITVVTDPNHILMGSITTGKRARRHLIVEVQGTGGRVLLYPACPTGLNKLAGTRRRIITEPKELSMGIPEKNVCRRCRPLIRRAVEAALALVAKWSSGERRNRRELELHDLEDRYESPAQRVIRLAKEDVLRSAPAFAPLPVVPVPVFDPMSVVPDGALV